MLMTKLKGQGSSHKASMFSSLKQPNIWCINESDLFPIHKHDIDAYQSIGVSFFNIPVKKSIQIPLEIK